MSLLLANISNLFLFIIWQLAKELCVLEAPIVIKQEQVDDEATVSYLVLSKSRWMMKWRWVTSY